VAGEPVLSVDRVSVLYGGLAVLQDVSFHVGAGEILGLIGPNGAGKSTAINVASGFVRPKTGTVSFAGRSVNRLSPARRSRRGMARTFQNLELFGSLTVFENVLCGIEAADEQRSLRLSRRRANREAVREVLTLLNLEHASDTYVGQLSYGTKKLVELARVFVRHPSFVLLDEPVAGLNRSEKAEFAELFLQLHDRYKIAGVLVEHDMPTVTSLCSRLVVLDAGKWLAEGPVDATLGRPEVVAAYLGPIALMTNEGPRRG
jgi:branched-chain amino acid transport system ATP-binding protein